VQAAHSHDLEVIGAATTGSTETHAWDRVASERVRIYDLLDLPFQHTTAWQRFRRRFADLRRYRIRYAFLCNHDLPDTLAIAMILRLSGTRVFLMIDSKLDDKPRTLGREWLKRWPLLPYHGALVAGRRSGEYARFLGIRADRIAEGYDAVSIERVRAQAGGPPAPEGTPFRDRHFTVVARFVPKKNLFVLIDAYGRYCELAGTTARALRLCGSGELEEALRAEVARRGLGGLEFTGWLGADAVAHTLASSLALILPSIEEQWGLVINEALALGVPVLCSDNVGARDTLVRTAVNGYVFEPDNAEGLAQLMARLSTDQSEWERLACAAREFARHGDTAPFVAGVDRLIAAVP
jgi:glycosyltransferase involved in cell wall biosynthesis